MKLQDGSSGLTMPAVFPEALALEVEEYGVVGAETGAFLLAPLGSADEIAFVAFAGEEGIVRERDVFRVSGRAIERLFGWADENKLRVRALVHSHQRRAFLSRTDLEHGFAVHGFTTVVVPWYAAPSSDPSDWAWWRYDAGSWQALGPAAVIDREAHFFVFDERGIFER